MRVPKSTRNGNLLRPARLPTRKRRSNVANPIPRQSLGDGFVVRMPKSTMPKRAKSTGGLREFRLWRRYPRPAPDKRACRSSGGVCEPNPEAKPRRWVRRADAKKHHAQKGMVLFGTRNGNRTHNYPLGGGYYIHLTMQAYEIGFWGKDCLQKNRAGSHFRKSFMLFYESAFLFYHTFT